MGGQHGAQLGPTGPKWAPCWPHETCYLGINVSGAWGTYRLIPQWQPCGTLFSTNNYYFVLLLLLSYSACIVRSTIWATLANTLRKGNRGLYTACKTGIIWFCLMRRVFKVSHCRVKAGGGWVVLWKLWFGNSPRYMACRYHYWFIRTVPCNISTFSMLH